ncbi:MAG: hypothetical protein KDA28_17345 [Phycisphaerales bacterium]|nr:hypothetical protein [Phycisphaerales bacterium]
MLHLFEKARTLDGAERAAFIEARSAGDADLGRDLELLLARADRDHRTFDPTLLLDETNRRAIDALFVDRPADPTLDESLEGGIPTWHRHVPKRAPWRPPAIDAPDVPERSDAPPPVWLVVSFALCLFFLVVSAL